MVGGGGRSGQKKVKKFFQVQGHPFVRLDSRIIQEFVLQFRVSPKYQNKIFGRKLLGKPLEIRKTRGARNPVLHIKRADHVLSGWFLRIINK